MATESYTCFAIAAPGLEPILGRELSALGEQPHIDDGGVSWEGDARSMMRANLWLRTASRVLVRVARFRAIEFYELEQRAKKIRWDDFLTPDRGVTFRVTARKSKLYHSDAIAERLIKATRRPAAEEGQLFVVRVFRDEFTISVDTSGDLLHMRGYRQAVGKAPLRETLAAALLLSAGWGGGMPLLDPLCGSGTIPIEGALLARRIAPGISRRFAFMDWPSHYEPAWRSLKTDAANGVLASAPVAIMGSDRDAGAIEAASANAERAGVARDLTLSVSAVSAVAPGEAKGLVATNPPYGKRVGDERDVRDLYAQFGNVLRSKFAGWQVALYSPDPKLTKQIALPLSEALRTTNGGIRVAALLGNVPD